MKGIKILERILLAIPIMLGIAIIIFFFMRLTPGDPVDIMMGKAGMVSKAEIANLRKEFNLDKPLHIQLFLFLKGLLKFDLGKSFTKGMPVMELIKETLPATIELALFALMFALIIAIPVGVISAVKQNSWMDRFAMAGSFFGISMPHFWLAIVAILIFSVKFNLLPTQGRISYGVELDHITGLYVLDSIITGNLEALIDALKHIILPAVSLGAAMAAIVARVMRSSMLEVLRQDYIVLARAKGLPEWLVITKHAVKNALIPTITVVGMQMGVLLGGNMIIETVFGWPGIGRMVVNAIFARDYPLVQGVVMFYAFVYVAANLVVDIIYTVVNPKIQL